MKRLIALITSLSFLSSVTLADCKFNDLVHNADGTVTYSKADHVCVGQTVQDNTVKSQQIQDLMKAVSLKDAALADANKRADNWAATAAKEEQDVQKADALKSKNAVIWLVIGIAAGAAATSLAIKH